MKKIITLVLLSVISQSYGMEKENIVDEQSTNWQVLPTELKTKILKDCVKDLTKERISGNILNKQITDLKCTNKYFLNILVFLFNENYIFKLADYINKNTDRPISAYCLASAILSPQEMLNFKNKYLEIANNIATDFFNNHEFNVEQIRLSIDWSTNLDFDMPLLLSAIYKNKLDLAKLLIAGGANVNKSCKHYFGLPLNAAIRFVKDIDFIKFLLEAGANVNPMLNDPPIFALLPNPDSSAISILKLLTSFGANVNICKNGKSALIDVASNGHFEILQFLIDNGADVNFKNFQGNALIHTIKTLHKYFQTYHLAPYDDTRLKEYLQIINMLILKGTDVNIQDGTGNTALAWAADLTNDLYHYRPNRSFQSKIIETLIKANASLNLPDINGNTPLIKAVRQENFEITKLLINSGAKVTIKNREKKTAYDYACDKRNAEIIDLLKPFMK